MPKFAANLSMMFTEWSFLDRFAAAADAGFAAVEFLFPYEYSADAIAAQLQRHGLTQALFNLPPGDWGKGERGMAALPSRLSELQAGVETALIYAEATGCRRLHLMAGIAPADDAKARAAYREAVAWTAGRVGEAGRTLVLEPINGRDMPGYFLNDFAYAEALITELALPNLRLQFDIYHRAIMHGDVTMALRRLMPMIGHIQIASVPSRHEPDAEEVNYPFLLAELDRLGYDGFVGCEYRPAGHTVDGLGWFKPHRGILA
ncbi:2-oxo-tetronate isomerase [Acidisoma silvae]|uniref:Hydroxypyruvate isomerase family protein n=1 Tax=Acidisoma silvae TaxID=2802396 RepID=A0A964E024_9PROT|nr:2-oxo-tetronate isomerase [Acidisoma silvae]MCB8876901.1 hydroxypyruvate isomerase family protein [Acidisoma silvae]